MTVGLAPLFVVLLAASVVAAYTSVRPIQTSILPGLVGQAEQLTAANALTTILEGAGVLVGPFLCGVILGFSTTGAVYLAAGAATLVGAVLVAGIARTARTPEASLSPATTAATDLTPTTAPTPIPPVRGLRAVTEQPSRLLAVLLLAIRFGVAAAMDVLLVLAAIELLGMGNAGAGYLSAAIGLGWVLGGACTLVVVGRPRLTPLTVVGGLIWGIPVAIVALVVRPEPALALLVVAGIGLAIVDVAVRTVLFRLVSTQQMASVFGIAEGASMAGAATGALSAGVLVAILGLAPAIIVAGIILPIAALAALGVIGRGEAAIHIPFREIALLRRIPLFAPVPAPALESAAGALVPKAFAAGTTVIREGDVGREFWVVDSGELDVDQGGLPIAHLGPGASFGELALIRDIPRTASVVASTDVALLALDREAFLLTVSASPRAVAEASAYAARTLERDHTAGGPAEHG